MSKNWETKKEIYDDLSSINLEVTKLSTRKQQVNKIMSLFEEHTVHYLNN